MLEDLSKRCDACQLIRPARVQFIVSIGAEHFRFNEEIYMDVMHIRVKPVLHFVDAAANFSAARFLPDVSTAAIWATFVKSLASAYTGIPNRIHVDRGTCFGDSILAVAKGASIDIRKSGIETH